MESAAIVRSFLGAAHFLRDKRARARARRRGREGIKPRTRCPRCSFHAENNSDPPWYRASNEIPGVLLTYKDDISARERRSAYRAPRRYFPIRAPPRGDVRARRIAMSFFVAFGCRVCDVGWIALRVSLGASIRGGKGRKKRGYT